MLKYLLGLFAADFVPHGFCMRWRPEVLWTHVISDIGITLAYLCIPVLLVYFVRKRRDIPFSWMFVAFGTFILACGATHAMSIVTLWKPVYRLEGFIKAITAIASLATAVCLARLLPRLFKIPNPTQLVQASAALALEIKKRKAVEQLLQSSREELDVRVNERTTKLTGVIESIRQERRTSDSLRQREQRMQLAALVELSLNLAGVRDPERLLQGVSRLACEIFPAEYGGVGILDDDGETIRWVFSITSDAAAVNPAMPLVRPGTLAKVLEERRPVRLRDVASGSLGLAFLPADSPLSSVLCVPISGATHARGWLFVANKLGACEFSDEDEQAAVTFASHAARAYETMEETRRAYEELCESKEVYEAMFVSAPDAIAAVNQHGRIVQVNAQTQKLFGYTQDELVGQPVEILVPERFRHAHPGHRQQYSNQPRRRPMGEGLELFGRRKDASEFPVDIMLSPLETKRGKMMLSVVRDATARKQNEQRIQQLNQSLEKHVEELQAANRDLETFTYSVSHDLRAPLRQVDGFARILRERIGAQADPDTSHYLQRIQDAAIHMASLLDGLLDLGRLGRQGLRVQLTDLNSVASQVVEELKIEVPHRQIEWILEPLPVIHCDAVLMKAVFSNLLSNAVKFTRLRECAIIRVGQMLENGETVIFVADNGVGFNMKYADKLFGIFQRLHRSEDFPGTGIGLATVHRIIRKHGGRIWADSEINSRATFYFTVARVDIEPAGDSKRKCEVIHE